MNIQVTPKTVYGVQKFYPVNKDAELIAAIANTTTLTADALKACKTFGHTVEVVHPTITI